MKKLYTYILLSMFPFLVLSCANDEEDDINIGGEQKEEIREEDYNKIVGRRTIIAYITGDNNLSSQLSSDIHEMVVGSDSLPSDFRLIVFADIRKQNPYIAHIRNGELIKVKEFSSDFYSTSPDSMRSVYQWIINNYPSEEYATVISGHGSGPIIRTDTIDNNLFKLWAYGYDDTGEDSATSTSKWMNVPSLAAVFRNLVDHNGKALKMSYIFFDCCCFQTIEVAYELRELTEYIIAPVSETPANGADYEQMLPALCEEKEHVANSIVKEYVKKNHLCISAIKTDQLEDLCKATKEALKKISRAEIPLVLERKNCIYYYKGAETGYIRQPALHDIKCLMRINLKEEEYEEWLTYLENAVISKHLATIWITNLDINFASFHINMNDKYYGGLSMIAPTDAYDKYNSDLNKTMFQLKWCNDVGWHDLGW